MTRLLTGILILTGWAWAVQAAESLELCFNYGCSQTVPVLFSDMELAAVRARFAGVQDAAGEREVLAQAVADLYRVAGEQSPIVADRGGNYADNGVEGRMDCIDHSTNTTRFLELMASKGWLAHHVVREPSRRSRIIFQHFSAVVEERDDVRPSVAQHAPEGVPDHVAIMLALCDCPEVAFDGEVSKPMRPDPKPEPALFVVDSWFEDHAQPAVIMPLANWLNGEGPNVQ